MQLKSIENEADLVDQPTASDLDAASRLGPVINKHLTSLEALCRLIPDCAGEITKIKDLRNSISQKINLQSNVLETPITVEQRVQQHSHKAVGELTNKLRDMAKGSSKLDYDSIDRVMTEIGQQNKVTPDDLHKLFAASHGGMTPDDYAKAVRDHSINEEIYGFFAENIETLGESIWVALSRHLKSQGYESDLINESIDKAIEKLDL